MSGLEAWNKHRVMTKPLTRGPPAEPCSVHLTLQRYRSNAFSFSIPVDGFFSTSPCSCKSFNLCYCFKIRAIFGLMSPITLPFL